MLSHPSRGIGVEQWHIITPEYPPEIGGVSDYTRGVAAGLASKGDEVHVWCPKRLRRPQRDAEGVVVHQTLGMVTPADLLRTGKELDRFPRPRRLLVQWVPHGYGYRSMNVPFCLWLWNRARIHGDLVEVMVHEPYLAFSKRSWKGNLAAVVHRLMTVILLEGARQIWLSIPGWEPRLRPYTLGRRLPFLWLPVPSNLPVVSDTARVEGIRRRYASSDTLIVGHFGTYGWPITSLLEPILIMLAASRPGQRVLLMGMGSQEYRQKVIEKEPRLVGMLFATGALTPDDASVHLAACDALIQPYGDGASSRRSSLMAGLSHGKPIVTTYGHLTEPCWKESGAVALSPAGDASSFVTVLEALRSDPDERVRLGRAAHDLYRTHFDLAHTISALRSRAAMIDHEQLKHSPA